jgi:hypothetical protein
MSITPNTMIHWSINTFEEFDKSVRVGTFESAVHNGTVFFLHIAEGTTISLTGDQAILLSELLQNAVEAVDLAKSNA